MVKFTKLPIDHKKYFKLKKFHDTRMLSQNPNKDLSFKVPGKEIINPFTVIPQSVYHEFHRDTYVRNKISFPITIPIHYRHVYLPKDYMREVKETPKGINLAIHSGNQLLYSLSKFEDYSIEEISEMLYQMSLKPKAGELNLEENPLL